MAGRVIITGFMGSGKTTVGHLLAMELGTEFIDTDVLAEQRMGMSISEAFERKGEQYFREAEEAVIVRLLEEGIGTDAVISLGGGAVTSDRVRQLLEAEAVILLDVDVDTAYERSHGGKRPLASDRHEFELLFHERADLYRRVASSVVEVGERGADDLVEEIIVSLKGERQ